MIKKLTRFEVADIKAVAQRTSALRRRRESVYNKILALNEELEGLDHTIQRWEEPILGITEGLYSVDALKHIKDCHLIIDEPENPAEAEAEATQPAEGEAQLAETALSDDNTIPEDAVEAIVEVDGNSHNPAE